MEYLCERVCSCDVHMCAYMQVCLLVSFPRMSVQLYILCLCPLVTAPLTVGPAHWWGRGAEPPCVHSKQGRHMMCMQFCALVLLTQLLCLLYVLHADQHDSVRTYAHAHRCIYTCIRTYVHVLTDVHMHIYIHTKYIQIPYSTCNSTVTFTSIYVSKDTKNA